MKQNRLLSVRNVTVMAMFGALAAVLMIFEAVSYTHLDVYKRQPPSWAQSIIPESARLT